jgi:hypothetical protein
MCPKPELIVIRGGQVDTRRGKASPKLLKPHLRALPGEWVTDEVPDGDKVHELDDPHIVAALTEERSNKERGIETLVERQDRLREERKAPAASQDPREHHLTQWRVDLVRLRVLRELAQRALARIECDKPVDWSIKHLWFPADDDRIYELRSGNPPSDDDRPKHLRRINLHIDIRRGSLPGAIRRFLDPKNKPKGSI